MRIDSKPDSKSLSGQVTSINDIDKKYDITTYYKGASVIRMMESFLGLETLNKGLTSYLNDKSFNNAKEDDLFIHLEAAALEDGSWPQEGVSDLSSPGQCDEEGGRERRHLPDLVQGRAY